MHALPWGHAFGAPSLAVTKGGELPFFLGEPQLRPVEEMASASGHALPKLVAYRWLPWLRSHSRV